MRETNGETSKYSPPTLADLNSPDKSSRDAAFSEWYEHDNPYAVNFANKFVHDRETAEELAQEGWTKVLAKVSDPKAKFTPETNLEAYLTTTIRHLATDNARKRERRKTELTDDDGDLDRQWTKHVRDKGVSIADKIAGDDSVKQVLAGIPEEHKETFYRREILGDTYDEISNDSGKGLGTVRSSIYRGRKAAKKTYGRISEEPPALLPSQKKEHF